jgi:hypothetical protein
LTTGSPPAITRTTGTATLYSLFSTGADEVNFTNLTPIQQQAVAAGADTTHGFGGNDNVTLPNSGSATFYTGSMVEEDGRSQPRVDHYLRASLRSQKYNCGFWRMGGYEER